MNNLTFRTRYFYPLVCLFFLIDIIFNGYFERQILQTLFCFIILGSIKKPSIFSTIFALILLSLESFLFYGRFGFDLGIIIPLVFVARTLDKTFTTPYFIANSLIFSYLIIKLIILEKLILSSILSLNYTFLFVFVNLILSIVLKFLIQGRPGNRFYSPLGR